MRPATVKEALAAHPDHLRQRHQYGLSGGLGKIYVPNTLHGSIHTPSAHGAGKWEFPASLISLDPRSCEHTRHHRHESVRQRTVKEAARKLALTQLANRHTLGHSFATHLLEDGYDIFPIQERRGHPDVKTKTTMMYTHVLNRGAQGVYSPIKRL